MSLEEVLPRPEPRARRPRPLIPWHDVVGAALGTDTRFVDVDGDGRLRVIARNEATRRELLSRKEDLLATWNAVAARLDAKPALEVVSWVRADLADVRPVSGEPR